MRASVLNTDARRWLVPLVLAVAAALALSTCGSDGTTDRSSATTEPSAATTSTPADEPTDSAADPELPIVFGDPDPALDVDELALFAAGEQFFHEVWNEVGPTETGTDGLGPLFNADSCAACHSGTGRRLFPPQGELDGVGLLLRIAVPGVEEETGAPAPHPDYGDQLQDRSVGGIDPEGVAWTDYVTQTGTYADGTPFEILWPTQTVRQRNYGDLGDLTQLSARNGAQLIGMGLLEAIPAETIRSFADPNDADGDGVSGRLNVVWDSTKGEQALGRFGWKSNVATLEQQIAQAFAGDLGVTSRLLPEANCAPEQTACLDAPTGGTAEVNQIRLDAILVYLRGLAVPTARTAGDPAAEAGQQHFREFGCTTCHVETITTGPSPIGGLAAREIHPYTDLLVHDMGFDMADDRPDFLANGNEWRTQPLWGLGLTPVIEGSMGLLHDGRARTIEEAVLWHGGEGRRSRAAFVNADATTRDEVLAFLRSL